MRQDVLETDFRSTTVILQLTLWLLNRNWDFAPIAQLGLQSGYFGLELRDQVGVLTNVVLHVQHIPLHTGFDVLSPVGVLKGVVGILVVTG